MRKLTLTLFLLAASLTPLHASFIITTSSCGGSPDPTVLCSTPQASLSAFGDNTLYIQIFNTVIASGPNDPENPAPYYAYGTTRAAVYAYIVITGGTGQGTFQAIPGSFSDYRDASILRATTTEQLSSNFAWSGISFTFGVPFLVYIDDTMSTTTSSRSFAETNYTSIGGTYAPYDSNGNRVFSAVIQPSPEPATYAFAGSGILALVMIGRRRSMARQSV